MAAIDPPQPPLSRAVVGFAAGVLGLTLAALLLDGRRASTGELLVQADPGTLVVSIRQGARVIVAATEKRSITLAPGDYEVVIEGGGTGRRAVPSRVRITRGSRTAVRTESPPAARATNP